MGLRQASGALVLFLLTQVGCDSAMRPGATLQRYTVEIENIAPSYPVLKSGFVNLPQDATSPGPLGPSQVYSISFTAPERPLPNLGMRLNLALMFLQSNDRFYAFRPEGLDLFPNGVPLNNQEVTAELRFYDAGTEVNEEPGVGASQPQENPEQGTAENGSVALVELDASGTDAMGHTYPTIDRAIQVVVMHDGGTTFTVLVRNRGAMLMPSGGGAPIPVLFSPVAWAVHLDSFDLFELGSPASEGLERLAEEGDPIPFRDDLTAQTGVTTLLSPGAFAVHTREFEWFSIGGTASSGIERIAEDGDPTTAGPILASADSVHDSGIFLQGVNASSNGPIFPGDSFRFSFEAEPDDRLSLAFMLVQSNDLFYSFATQGLPLFEDGAPAMGDVTERILLFDAGTEGDEEPGVGPFQPIRQPSANTGPPGEGEVIRIGGGGMHEGFQYPNRGEVLRVTITPDVEPAE